MPLGGLGEVVLGPDPAQRRHISSTRRGQPGCERSRSSPANAASDSFVPLRARSGEPGLPRRSPAGTSSDAEPPRAARVAGRPPRRRSHLTHCQRMRPAKRAGPRSGRQTESPIRPPGRQRSAASRASAGAVGEELEALLAHDDVERCRCRRRAEPPAVLDVLDDRSAGAGFARCDGEHRGC